MRMRKSHYKVVLDVFVVDADDETAEFLSEINTDDLMTVFMPPSTADFDVQDVQVVEVECTDSR